MIKKLQNVFINKPRLTAAVLGTLYTLGFAPFLWWFIGLLALSGLFYLFKQSQYPRQALKVGVSFGLAHYVTSLHWIIGSFYVTIGDLPMAIAVGGLAVLALSFYLSLYIGFVGFFIQKYKNHSLLPLIFACLWLFSEFIRSSLTPTFAWNLAGYQWAYANEMLQMASVGGIYLLSFVFVFLAAALFTSKRWCLCSFLVMMLFYGYGYQRLAKNPPIDVTTQAEGKVHIRLVSGNVNQFDKWKIQKRRTFIQNYITKSNEGDDIPNIVVWPETAITSALNKHRRLRRYLADEIQAKILITGAPYKDNKGRYYNSMYVLDSGGGIVGRYDKRFLIPFGEYFPFRQYFPAFFEQFLQGQGEYTAGLMNQESLPVTGLTFAPLICGEVVLPSLSNIFYPQADYVLNISNDAWFKGTIGPQQHFAFVKVRAVALHKHFIRVGNYGINAFIDRFGRILKKVEASQSDNLDIYL